MNYQEHFYSVINKHSKSLSEWELDHITLSDDWDKCICTHDIKEVCFVKHKESGVILKIGNCCIKKFDFRVEGWSESLFDGFKRILENDEKAPNPALIEYSHKNSIINDWERDFLKNTKRKRKMSEKQTKVRKRINNKIIKKMKNNEL